MDTGFLTHLHFTRYDALRDSGYHVFFRAAVTGGILARIAHLIVFLLHYFLPWMDPAYKLFRQEQPSHKKKDREDAEQG